MNRKAYRLSYLMPILAIALTLSLASRVAAQTVFSMSGTVLDAGTKLPVQAAEVRAVASNKIITTVLTDAQGKFAIPDMKPGEYSVSAYRKFYERSPDKKINVEKMLRGQDFTIKALDATPALELSTSDITPLLPGPDDEKGIFLNRCTNCHTLGVPLQSRRTAAGWEAVYARMIQIFAGAGLADPKVKGPIMDYLTKNFGPDSKAIDEFSKQAKAVPQPVPLGSDIEYTQIEVPMRTFGGPPVPPELVAATYDSKGTVWFTESAAHGNGGPVAPVTKGTFNYGEISTIGKIDLPTGKVTQMDLKTPNVSPYFIELAPDGKIWFTAHPAILGNIDPKTGAIEEIPVPLTKDGKPGDATTMGVGKDGLIWYCSRETGSINSYDPETKKFKIYVIEDGSGWPFGIEWHGDQIWFGLIKENKVGYLKPSTGEIKTYPIPSPSGIERLRVDKKGRVWIPERESHKVGLMAPGTDKVVETDLPTNCSPYTLEVDKKGIIWVLCQNRASLVRVDPDTMAMTEYPMPAGSGGVGRELTLDSEGGIWYAEWYGRRVTRFRQIGSQ
jgi:streptogramin lyase